MSMLRNFLLEDEEHSDEERITGDDYDGVCEEEDLAEQDEAGNGSDSQGEDDPSPVQSDASVLAPPLPLIDFGIDSVAHKALTLTGETLPTVEHVTADGLVGSPLHNPLHSRRLAKWFTVREGREEVLRTMDTQPGGRRGGADGSAEPSPPPPSIEDILVFESNPFEFSDDGSPPPPSRNSAQSPKKAAATEDALSSSLDFDSLFESGNMHRALRVTGREQIQIAETVDCGPPSDCDQEYDMMCRKDLHTSGNIQWYYFSATTPPSNVTYPLVVRFNIVNMLKRSSLYNFGMRPAVCSTADAADGVGWRHSGTDVCYFKNRQTYTKRVGNSKNSAVKKRLVSYYTLSFTYTFTKPDTVYFAHCYPYTYTRLQSYIVSLETDNRIAKFLRRRLLCPTLAQNRCELLTVTEPCDNAEAFARRPVVVVSARAHPGETNSSFMMEGFMTFLVSEDPAALHLRNSFVFKVVPMLNPDGVIHGNYRCSLAGCDLNRAYRSPDPYLHPTIYAVKDLILSSHMKRGVFLYLDLHGHSRNKNVFSYGCDPTLTDAYRLTERLAYQEMLEADPTAKPPQKSSTPSHLMDRKVFSRLLPKFMSLSHLLWTREDSATSTVSPFSYRDCSYKVQLSKKGAGRVVCWNDIGIDGSYTIEISFCGIGDNSEAKQIEKIFNSSDMANNGPGLHPGVAGVFSSIDEDGNAKTPFFLDSGNIADSEGEGGNASSAISGVHRSAAKLFESYCQTRTYTVCNLLNLGRDMGRAIVLMSNASAASNEASPPLRGVSSAGIHELMATARSAVDHLNKLQDQSDSANCRSSACNSPEGTGGSVTLPDITSPRISTPCENILTNATSLPGTPVREYVAEHKPESQQNSPRPSEDSLTVLPLMDQDSIGRPLLKPCVFSGAAIREGMETYHSAFFGSNDHEEIGSEFFFSQTESMHKRWRNQFSLRVAVEAIIRSELLTENTRPQRKKKVGITSEPKGFTQNDVARKGRRQSSGLAKEQDFKPAAFYGNNEGSDSGWDGGDAAAIDGCDDGADEEVESESDRGSDSDPSGDNIPVRRLLKNKQFRMFCKNARVPRASLQACVRKKRIRRKDHRNFDPITATRGFLQMSAPRKGSVCVDDSDSAVKNVKVINPRSIQRLFEGKRVHEGELIATPSRVASPSPAEQQQQCSVTCSPPSSVRVTDFAFNSLRRSHKPRYSGRSGSVNIVGGIGIGLKTDQFQGLGGSSHATDSSLMTKRKSASIGGEMDLQSNFIRPSGGGRAGGSSDYEQLPFASRTPDEKLKVSWSKAYAAASAFASGSTAASSGKSGGILSGSQTPILPRALSGGSLAGTNTASVVDWRFHRQNVQPAYESKKDKTTSSKYAPNIRGSQSPSSDSVASVRLTQRHRTVTSDTSGSTKDNKVQPLFSDREMDKMFRQAQQEKIIKKLG